MYELKTEKFTGPLEKLLELIEAQKLGIDDVSLAKVTDGFLKYLEEFRKGGGSDAGNPSQASRPQTDATRSLPLEGEELFRADLRVLADFIAVASRLILLKSKYLLPGLALTQEEEADIKDLEARLAKYRELRPAIIILAKLWRASPKSYSRPYFLGRGTGFAADQHVFYPGTRTNASALTQALQRLFDTIVTYELETQTIKDKIVSLEEKIQEVMQRITREGEMHLSSGANGGQSRSEMVVVFLALLHLAREQLVKLEQVSQFSDIMVRKVVES
jgi:segregation and condensation protein A